MDRCAPTLYGGGRRMYLEPVRTLRHGRRRAYDVSCTTVDTDSGADPSVGSAVLGPDCPVMGGSTPGALSTGTAEPGTGVGSPTGPAGEGFSARAAAEAVRSAAAAPSADAALRAVIEMALRRGPWAAARISVLGPGGSMRPAACSGERAADADRLQIEVGQGPCLDAVRPEPDGACTAPVVVAVDLSTEQRWPRWASAATALGFRAVVALRLFTDHTVGSISLYARHPGVDSGALQDAQVVAALASVVLARVCSERDLWRAVQLPGPDRAGTGHADAALRGDRGHGVRGSSPLLPAAQHETRRAGRTAHHDGRATRPPSASPGQQVPAS